jgi:aminoglycoside phosphotransferase (APT) family kinase protein
MSDDAIVAQLAAGLAAAMARAGIVGAVTALERLSGGANMESWGFACGGAAYVLRRAPSADMMAGRPFGHDVEAALVRAAQAGGVRAPEVVAELAPADGIGSGYVMVRVMAEVNPAAILTQPPPSLIDDIAREMAAIHALPIDALPDLPVMDTAAALADLRARFMGYGGDRPIIALAITWCEAHLPAPAPPSLVHGDLRMGNIMVDMAPDGGGLAVVLDWELAHIGDRHEDLAYGCMTVWRFGQIDRPAFGVSDLATYFAAYQAHGGGAVDPARFRFWLVYRTLWWALGCLQMGDIWRQGIDRSLERAVIARRTSENELDLLLLLEPDAPDSERGAIPLPAPTDPRRMGEPSTVELIEAVREWIDTDIKAKAQGRDRFMAAVAMNALGMLAREAANPVVAHDKPLCDAILAGEVTLATPGLLARLRALALAKLANDVPKYAALDMAQRAWATPRPASAPPTP